MDKAEIQQQIVSHFWSKELKKYIAEANHVFGDEELVTLVWHYVPEYHKRLQLFELIAEYIPTASEHAQLCANFMEASLARFLQNNTGEVYELRIVDQEDPEERYLCDSYETALQMIDNYWKEYDFSQETPTTEYTIVKRIILRMNHSFRDGVFSEDQLGRCVLGPGKVLLRAEMDDNTCEYHPHCSENCMECQKPCVFGTEVMYPPFLPNLTTVKYRSLHGKIEFGLTFEPGRSSPGDSVYVLPLGGKIESDWWDHEHIPHPDVDIALEEEMSDEQIQAAAAVRTFLEKHMNQYGFYSGTVYRGC